MNGGVMQTLHQQIQSAGHKVYGQVNRMWPDELPILEKIEAERAYKKLINKFGSKKVWSEYSNKWITEKKSVRRTRKRGTKTWKIRVRKCWLSLNGDTNSLSKGWRRLVHDVSHYVYYFRFPNNSQDHNIAQAKIEHEMAQFVINSGWLEGKLKPIIKQTLTKDEKKSKKLLNFEKLLKKWESKMNLANTKVKIYKRRIKNLK
jgi:hypothetical protein